MKFAGNFCKPENEYQPHVIARDVVKERLGLVIVAVGSQWIFLISITLTVLSIHPRITFILPIQSLLWLLI